MLQNNSIVSYKTCTSALLQSDAFHVCNSFQTFYAPAKAKQA